MLDNSLALPAIGAAVLGYVAVGMFFWAILVTQAEDPDELAFVAAASLNPWMALGRALMIATWPVWVVVPTIVLCLRGARRG